VWWAKLEKVFAEAWGQAVAPDGRIGSSTPLQGLLLSNGAIKPQCLTPQTVSFANIHKLSELRRHQRAPDDVHKSEKGACVKVSRGRTAVKTVERIASDKRWA
jgi:hypothetical protein